MRFYNIHIALSVIIIFLFIIQCSYAQVYFQRTYFDGSEWVSARSVQQTIDGGYIVAGNRGQPGGKAYLIKTGAIGDLQWSKEYGGYCGESASSIQQTTDKGYIVCGSSCSFYIGPSGPCGLSDVYIIKTDSTGDTLWTKVYGSSNNEGGSFVQQTTDGGYIILGGVCYGFGAVDFYLIKTDATGGIQWSKTYGAGTNDLASSVIQTPDKGYLLTGYTLSSFGAGNDDIYLIKTDSIGNVEWAKIYGGSNNEQGISVAKTLDGGYIIGGHTMSFGVSSTDMYLIRINASGDVLWSKTFGGSSYDNLESVLQTSDMGFILVGYTFSFGAGGEDVYLVKTDSAGNLLWAKTYGFPLDDRGNSIQQTNDSGYIIAGYAESSGSTVAGKYTYLIKTDANGNSNCNNQSDVTSLTSVSNPITIVGAGVTIDTLADMVYGTSTIDSIISTADSILCPNCNISITTDLLPDTSNTGAGMAWVYIAGGTPPYTYQWNDTLMQTTDTAYNLFTGTYNVVITDNNGCSDSSSVIVGNVTEIFENDFVNTLQIHPNPTNSTFTIFLNYPMSQSTNNSITIYNPLGEIVYQSPINSQKSEIDLSGQPNGIYFLQVRTGQGVVRKKIVLNK